MISASEQRTALYRFYDEHEELLYVGISNDPWRRWREHVYDKRWYLRVKHQAVTWYDSEDQARGAETRAIRAERPQFNVAGAVRPPEARRRLNPSIAVQICALWICIPGLFSGIGACIIVSVPQHSLAESAGRVLAWIGIVAFFSLPLPVIAGILIGCAPLVYRFGCWLDRNFGELSWQQVKVAADVKQMQRIPGWAWILAPRQTYRVRGRMKTTGPGDYMQALGEDFIARHVVPMREASR